MKATRKGDGVERLNATMKALRNTTVLVGIPAETAERSGRDPINNATLGYIHEHGAPAAGIPARPFLIPGVRAVQERVGAELAKAGRAALIGDGKTALARLHAAGLIAQSSVRGTINAGVEPGLAQSTVQARAGRGRTGTVPLIDTGALRNSITYVVQLPGGQKSKGGA